MDRSDIDDCQVVNRRWTALQCDGYHEYWHVVYVGQLWRSLEDTWAQVIYQISSLPSTYGYVLESGFRDSSTNFRGLYSRNGITLNCHLLKQDTLFFKAQNRKYGARSRTAGVDSMRTVYPAITTSYPFRQKQVRKGHTMITIIENDAALDMWHVTFLG